MSSLRLIPGGGDRKPWPRADLAIAWFAAGGVAYVFEGTPTGTAPTSHR